MRLLYVGSGAALPTLVFLIFFMAGII